MKMSLATEDWARDQIKSLAAYLEQLQEYRAGKNACSPDSLCIPTCSLCRAVRVLKEVAEERDWSRGVDEWD